MTHALPTLFARRRNCLAAALGLALALITFGLAPAAHATVTGSAYNTADGTETGSPADWQQLASSPGLSTELGGYTCYGGGQKEDTPNAWTLATGSACIPGKSQILGMWSSEEVLPTDSFLHMAFERAATTGNTFITFELNQSNKTWVNGARATIPCRSDGDVLLSFTPTSTPIVTANVWTGDGTGPAACPDGATGSFAASSSFNFEGAVNSAAISNYLSPGALGATFTAGAFGEGTLSIQGMLSALHLGCRSYIQVQAHSRSSSSISSSLIEAMAPVAMNLGNCNASGTVYENSAGDGTHHAGEAGLGGVQVYADTNGNGNYDAGEPTATTDTSGRYAISGVPAGTANLRLNAPAGAACTSPSPCAIPATVSTSLNSTGNDFELFAVPAPTLTAPADGAATNNPQPTLSAAAQPNTTVTFYLDGNVAGSAPAGSSGNASLPLTSVLADGPHTVYATDTDGSGSTSPESNTNTFTVTTSVAPPSITSPADGTLTNHTSMTVLISGVGNGDGSLWVNGTVYNFSFDVTGHAQVDLAGPLADGACTLKATQEDTLGNSSDLSAPVSFTVKTSIGAPTVLTPADGTLTNERTPTVTLTADAGTTDTVYIDGARVGTTFADGAGYAYLALTGALADGPHTVRATAADGLGNVSADSNTNTFTVDSTAPPAPTVTTPADGSTSRETSPTVTVSGEAGDRATVIVDGAAYGPVTLDGSGAGQINIPAPLSAGQHNVHARQSDPAGNRSPDGPTNIWTVKRQTDVHLTGPSAGRTASNRPTVAYRGEAGDEYTITVDGTPVATGVTAPGGLGQLQLPAALADGPHTIAILATDPVGNTAADSVVVTVDARAPHTPVITDAPAQTTQLQTGTFSFTDSEPGDTYECSLDGSAWAACESPHTYTGLADGPHSFLVRSVNDLGTRSPSVQYGWTVDTVAPPAPPILAGPGANVGPGPTQFTFSPQPGAILECSLDGGAWNPCPATLDLQTVGLGDHLLEVRQRDEAGLVSAPSTYRWTVVSAPQTPASRAHHARLIAAARAGVNARGRVNVGCRLDAGSLGRCLITAYYHGRAVGTGAAPVPGPGRQSTAVPVKLNVLGLRLLSRARGGLPVRFAANASEYAQTTTLPASGRSVLYLPDSYIIPDVLFAFDSYRLNPRARAVVSQLARDLRGARTVACEGNTDSQGAAAYNTALGLDRAQSVCRALRALGVHAPMRALTRGESRPVASNRTAEGRHLNRRVLVRVTYRSA